MGRLSKILPYVVRIPRDYQRLFSVGRLFTDSWGFCDAVFGFFSIFRHFFFDGNSTGDLLGILSHV